MYCKCYEKNIIWLKLTVLGGLVSFLLMIAGMPFFHPKMVLFPLPWVLGILMLFVSLTLPFYAIKHDCKEEGKKRK